MTLALDAPLGLLALFAIPVLVWLHRRRGRPPERALGSLALWRGLSGGEAPPLLRRLARPLPLLLRIGVAALLAGALARPVTTDPAPATALVALDRGAGGAAPAEGGGTRFEAAVRAVETARAALPAGTGLRLRLVPPGPAFTLEQAARAGPSDRPVSPEAWSALVAEGAWLALARPRRGLPAGAGGFAARGPADNVGLVGFEVSGAPPVALVTVRNAGERASRGAVRVGAPGGPFRERALEVGPRATVSIEEPLPGPLPAIEARLAPGDGFAADDAAWAVRRPRKPRAALVGDDLPYVAAALEVAGFEVVRGAAAGATLVVATGIAPAADGNPARTLLVEPPAAAVGLEGGAPFAPGEPRAVGGGPDLTGVAVLHAVGYRAAPGWETLAEAGGRPLILRSGPRTVLAFRPEDAVTNWVRRPSFPAFVAALAAEAAAAAGAGAEWSFHRTGDTVPIAAPPGSMVVVTDPGGAQLGLPSGPDGRALWVPERVGLHVVRAGGREEWTAVNLLSAAASDLADGVEPAAAPLRARPGPARRQDRAPLLLALALLLGTLLWLAERP